MLVLARRTVHFSRVGASKICIDGGGAVGSAGEDEFSPEELALSPKEFKARTGANAEQLRAFKRAKKQARRGDGVSDSNWS